MTPLDDDISLFLRDSLHSQRELEVLLLLHADPTAEWSPDDLAQRLRSSTRDAATCLRSLAMRGLVAASADRYRYGPASDHVAAIVDRLAALYPTHKVAVRSLIFSRGGERSLQLFADAFRLRDATKEQGDDEPKGGRT